MPAVRTRKELGQILREMFAQEVSLAAVRPSDIGDPLFFFEADGEFASYDFAYVADLGDGDYVRGIALLANALKPRIVGFGGTITFDDARVPRFPRAAASEAQTQDPTTVVVVYTADTHGSEAWAALQAVAAEADHHPWAPIDGPRGKTVRALTAALRSDRPVGPPAENARQRPRRATRKRR